MIRKKKQGRGLRVFCKINLIKNQRENYPFLLRSFRFRFRRRFFFHFSLKFIHSFKKLFDNFGTYPPLLFKVSSIQALNFTFGAAPARWAIRLPDLKKTNVGTEKIRYLPDACGL